MARRILVIGDPGTGKTVSCRNLNPSETFIISSDLKSLTFPGARKKYQKITDANGKFDFSNSNYYETNSIARISRIIKAVSDDRPEIKNVVIDTITSVIAEEIVPRLNEKGFDKFNEVAMNVYLLFRSMRGLREDLNVILLSHMENQYREDGSVRTSFKVPSGKAIGSMFVPEASFDAVLVTYVAPNSASEDEKYFFLTHNNGENTARTPMGLFSERFIPNDLSVVLSEFDKYEQ